MYYFISTINFDGKTLFPRIPINRMDNEDETIKRICVSQSIDGCLVATYYEVGDIVYIHTCESNKIISPSIEQVEDAPFTGERWILEPVEMKLFIRLKITKRISRKLGGTNLPMDTYCYDIYNEDLCKFV